MWLRRTAVVDTGENPGIGIYIFTGECPEQETEPSAEGTLEWIPIEDVPKLPIVEDLPVQVGCILKMRRSDPPFAGRSFYLKDRLTVDFLE